MSNIYPQSFKRHQFSKTIDTKSGQNVIFVAPRLVLVSDMEHFSPFQMLKAQNQVCGTAKVTFWPYFASNDFENLCPFSHCGLMFDLLGTIKSFSPEPKSKLTYKFFHLKCWILPFQLLKAQNQVRGQQKRHFGLILY